MQCDIHKIPYLTALDLATGNIIWKTSNKSEAETFGSPAIYPKNRKAQIINGCNHAVGCYFEILQYTVFQDTALI